MFFKPTLLCFLIGSLLLPFPAAAKMSNAQLEDVSDYISSNWDTLTRDMTKCHTFDDVKMQAKSSLFFPKNFAIPEPIKALQNECGLQITYLPKSIKKIERNLLSSDYHSGLLYLPNPYIVPGGMFNEMYGWDSYFIIRGLIENNQLSLAKGMLENFFFEIEHYGGVLNGNRAYYLSRSQPPFLTSMIVAVYSGMKKAGQADKAWLQNAYSYAVKDYQFWLQPPHLAGKTGLSRFFDFNDGPVAELKTTITSYYSDAAKYFLLHGNEAENYLDRQVKPGNIGPLFTVKLCSTEDMFTKEACNEIEGVALTKKFYQGDRALRESGMDITSRFGAFGAATIDYAPVELNSLLYKAEMDLETISYELGKKHEANTWHQRALVRREKINQFFWNKAKGLFFDFNFAKNQPSAYEYITTFYPLWVGLATPDQARAVKNNLKLFERKGGLVTSTTNSGAQWDYPYGWAPFQLIAIEGLRRYGYTEDADRLALAFLETVSDNFHRDGTIREKYDVVTSSSETKIQIGYQTNEIGFGWTNGVFLSLLHGLSAKAQRDLLEQANRDTAR